MMVVIESCGKSYLNNITLSYLSAEDRERAKIEAYNETKQSLESSLGLLPDDSVDVYTPVRKFNLVLNSRDTELLILLLTILRQFVSGDSQFDILHCKLV